MSLAMIVPTRSRPHNIGRLAHECAPSNESTRIVVGIDTDEFSGYWNSMLLDSHRFDLVTLPMREYLVPKLHRLARAYVALGYTHIGFMGDDHVPRTDGWDVALCAACGPCGMAYADDLEHGEELPTMLVVSAALVRALDAFGSTAPVRHLCCDMAWRDVGRGAGVLNYVSNVVIEHIHPAMEGTRHRGGAPMDDQYAATRTPEMYEHDNRQYQYWRDHHYMDDDIARVRDAVHDATIGPI